MNIIPFAQNLFLDWEARKSRPARIYFDILDEWQIWMFFFALELFALSFGVYMARRVWRAYTEYHQLIPVRQRRVGATRNLAGKLAMAGSLLYVILLCGLDSWAVYIVARDPDLATFAREAGRREAEALRRFDEGRRQMLAGEYRDAETSIRQASTLLEKLAIEFPNVPQIRLNLSACYGSLGDLFESAGRHSEAEDAYGKAIPLLKNLVIKFPESLEYRQYLMEAEGFVNACQGFRLWDKEPREAEAAFRPALTRFTELTNAHPGAPEYRQAAAQVQQALDTLRGRNGKDSRGGGP
jgi:tetratricopeptide (TPR) repeat protein